MVATYAPAGRSEVLAHLGRFDPDMRDHVDVALWAIRSADQGSWLSTARMGDRVVSVAQVVEQLQLGDFLDPTDPWAPA